MVENYFFIALSFYFIDKMDMDNDSPLVNSQKKMTKRKVFGLISLLVVFIAAAFVLFQFSFSYFKNTEYQRAQNRASLYKSTLLGELERFQHLPFILAKDPFVIAGAKGLNLDRLNNRLASFARRANLDAIYLMDNSGLTIAASNYKNEVTFLGQNYGFRPYFKTAMKGKRGEFFGIGATTSRPGYFIAQNVVGEYGQVLGVIALKLDLSDLSKAWNEGGELVFVSNSDGVVVLSSNKKWRYSTLEVISDVRRAEILLERQFAKEPLLPLDWRVIDNNSVKLNSTNYVHASTAVTRLGWKLHFLADERRVLERAWFSVIGASIVGFILLTLVLFLRSERIKTALKDSQADRNKLRAANAKLAQEIVERRAAEKRLEKAQVELARSSKLAALGQLSASVTHELGQPISAMQNYIAAAEFDENSSERKKTLNNLSGIISRMVNITKQLRFFAKPVDVKMEKLDLRNIWEGVDILVAPDIQHAEIKLDVEISKKPIWVKGNRLRLEQILVNLISNSIAAMQGEVEKMIQVKILSDDSYGVFSVTDSGHGLGENSIEQLKEPFHTTRASGDGMGLGLAISAGIVKEHDGAFDAKNATDGGAIFSVKIPLIRADENAK